MVLGLGSGPASNQSLGKHRIGIFLAPRSVRQWIGCQKASGGETDPLGGYLPTRLVLYCCQRKGHTLKGWTKSLVLCWPQGLVARKGVGELRYQVEMRVDTLSWYAHSQWFVCSLLVTIFYCQSAVLTAGVGQSNKESIQVPFESPPSQVAF